MTSRTELANLQTSNSVCCAESRTGYIAAYIMSKISRYDGFFFLFWISDLAASNGKPVNIAGKGSKFSTN